MRIYVDGELRGSVDISGEPGPQENNFPLLIGKLVDGSTCGSQPFEGEIDDVRIYNRALTPSEVGQLYSAETPNHAPVASGSATLAAVPQGVESYVLAGEQVGNLFWDNFSDAADHGRTNSLFVVNIRDSSGFSNATSREVRSEAQFVATRSDG